MLGDLASLVSGGVPTAFQSVLAAMAAAVTIFGGGLTLGKLLGGSSLKARAREAEEKLDAENERATALEDRFAEIQDVLDGAVNIWLRPTKHDVGQYIKRLNNSIPILTVANFKGGVGKTTVSANLAAYFELHLNKRVLLIDFDYQGSLTEILLAASKLDNVEASAKRLIQGEDTPEMAFAKAYSLRPELPKSQFFPCFYGFNKVENQVLLRWLTQPNAPEIRFNTHKYLSDPIVQKNFDVVIIDAAPRLMTATINAACASTHVLIPTMLDGLCTNATINTLGVFHELKTELNPALDIVGVLPTFVAQSKNLTSNETAALNQLRQLIPSYWKKAPFPEIISDAWICRKAAISRVAGNGLAFSTDNDVRDMFIALGDKISARIFPNEDRPTPDAGIGYAASVTPIASARRRG
ncbi:ParA family protein [Hyphomicrobium sp. D-2]|uniref:ParA family protein n=1 Tax=Hyphomicrobium sp. D-2 TaxID=3041621 RepID=UPI002457161E|nr:ParA family protein [Hyphomicrobium sp. D-2]MDH4983753.1 ParA family protein [Hyphomicrobium sp. D-2]